MSEESVWVVLTGRHGGGKSSIGRALAAAWGAPFDDEIGDEERARELDRDDGAFGFRESSGFEYRVFEKEVERDRDSAGQRRRVVETWHIGNLAYANCRSPSAAESLGVAVEAHVASLPPGVRVFVLPVTCSPSSAVERLSQRGAGDNDRDRALLAAWFGGVGDEARHVAARLARRLPRVTLLDALDTSHRSASDAAAEALRRVESGGGPPSPRLHAQLQPPPPQPTGLPPALVRFCIPHAGCAAELRLGEEWDGPSPAAGPAFCLLLWISAPPLSDDPAVSSDLRAAQAAQSRNRAAAAARDALRGRGALMELDEGGSSLGLGFAFAPLSEDVEADSALSVLAEAGVPLRAARAVCLHPPSALVWRCPVSGACGPAAAALCPQDEEGGEPLGFGAARRVLLEFASRLAPEAALAIKSAVACEEEARAAEAAAWSARPAACLAALARPPAAPFVALEGLDGVGKSTLAARLAALLPAERLATPPPALVAVRHCFAQRLLRVPSCAHSSTGPGGPSAARTTPLGTTPRGGPSPFRPLPAPRVRREARALRAAGRAVVLDRYWPSTACYGRAEGRAAGHSDPGVLRWPRDLPRPSATLVVSLPEAARRRRLAGRAGDATAEESRLAADGALREAVREGYRRVEGALHLLLRPEEGPDAAAAAALAFLRAAGVLGGE